MRHSFLSSLAVVGDGARAIRWLPATVPKLIRDEPAARFDPSDPEALEKAVRYSRLRERLWLISTAWSFALDGVSLAAGTPRALADTIRAVVQPRFQTPVFVLAWSVQDWLLRLPLAYYGG